MTASNTQTAILTYIKGYLRSNGYPPTRKEIATEFGIATNAAQYHCEQLAKMGNIVIAPNVARGIKVL